MKHQPVSIISGDSRSTIFCSEGGRVKNLLLNGIKIIEEPPMPYRNSYASSILFPFVNRIKNGTYHFSENQFRLRKNLIPNAIHGLVFDKKFEVVKQQNSYNESRVELRYSDSKLLAGFPYRYAVNLNYAISASTFTLNIKIENLDTKPFPFSVGWHPYFYTSDLDKSALKINSKEHFEVDKNMIPVSSKAIEWHDFKNLNNKNFDDGYKLLSNDVEFKTPDYHIKLSSSLDDNYLQLFTPADRNYFAIEPMSAAADSFNNKIGLKQLEPKQNFEVEWKIEML